MSKILELYGTSTCPSQKVDWIFASSNQFCPYLSHKCEKNRKSDPEITIGTCSVEYSREYKQLIICPYRLLERNQVSVDPILGHYETSEVLRDVLIDQKRLAIKTILPRKPRWRLPKSKSWIY